MLSKRNQFNTLIIFLFLLNFIFANTKYDAEFLEITKEYQLHSNGEISYTYHHKVKINSYLATNRLFGEDFIIYNPKYQSLDIIKSLTIMKDSSEVISPPNAFNEVLPRGASNAPLYNHLREMVVTHPGIERGCIVDFSYKITNRKDFQPGLMGEEIFSALYPIKSMIVKIIVPENTELKFDFMNCDIDSTPEVNITDNGEKTYKWHHENIKAVKKENNQLSMGEYKPRLVFSTIDSWDFIYDYLNPSKNGLLNLSAKVETKIDNLIDGIIVPQEKLTRLQKAIATETGHVKISPELTGFKPLAAEITFFQNTGTNYDKAFLLSSLLKYCGASSYPILVSRYNQFSEVVPSLLQFDDIIVKAAFTGQDAHYFHPSKDLKIDIRSTLSQKTLFYLNNSKNNLHKSKNYDRKDNKLCINTNLVINDDLSYSGNNNLNLSGKYNSYYEISNSNKAIENLISRAYKSISIKNSNLTFLSKEGCSANINFTSKEKLKTEHGYFRFTIPDFKNSFNSDHISLAIRNRKTPININYPFFESYTYSIELPENYNLITPEISQKLKNKIGQIEISLNKTAGKIILTRMLSINNAIIFPEEYRDLRNLIVKWQENHYRNLIFKKK